METLDRIYLDYAATTPLDDRVFEKMTPYFRENFGNPSSVHYIGQVAEAALEKSRVTVAGYLGCLPEEIFFTACGTESDNMAIKGAAFAKRKANGANRLLISPVEHHAVSRTAEQLCQLFGFEVDYLPVDQYGKVDPDDVQQMIDPKTALVSVIYANNEIGTINPVNEISDICIAKDVPFHTDAVQAAAHLPIDMSKNQISLMAIGAHKFYGPKGVGVLFCRKGTPIIPMSAGGGQENGLRSGTQNVPYIVGLAEAFKLTQDEIQEREKYLIPLRDQIIGTVLEEIDDVKLTGDPKNRLPNHASFVFKGVDGNELLMLLDAAGYACSSGSACKTGNPEPSEVLTAVGLSPEWGLGSLRITLGKNTTHEQVASFLKVLPEIVNTAR